MNRTHKIQINGLPCNRVCSSTGSQQESVLSSSLFIHYPNTCHSSYEKRIILKFADHSIIVLLAMVHSSATLLNGVMTSIFNYKSETKDVTSIKDQTRESDQSYKYLGAVVNLKLNFEPSCVFIYFQTDKTATISILLSFYLVSWF